MNLENLHIHRNIYIMREILRGGKLGFRRTAGDVTFEVLTREMIKFQVFCDVTLHH
jgi:hypothetical protein